MRSATRTLALAATTWVVAGACTGHTDPFDAPPADGDGDADGDSAGDAEEDGGPQDGDEEVDDASLSTGGGPITLVVQRLALTLTRLCDLDGDGDFDNSFADLGATTGELAAMALNTALQGSIDEEDRYLIHIPWVEDLAGPTDRSVVAISIGGVDSDVPVDTTDDFSGEEPFWGAAQDLDACGEPRYVFADATIVDGVVSSEEGTTLSPIAESVVTRGARATGTIEPGGRSATLEICAYSAVHDLGETEGLDESGDLTMLEVFLAGGAPMGIAMIPGFSPDVDMDHDGLESFVLDESYHVTHCIDGDLTTIAGRDCWRDPRMADGFSLTMRLECVAAELVGREPGWEDRVGGECAEPPATSLFDPT